MNRRFESPSAGVPADGPSGPEPATPPSKPAEAGLPGLGVALRGIRKAYPGVVALDGAGLAVRAGEIHGLVGENGAGKSTVIRILAGIERADAGAITADGATLEEASPQAMQALGIRVIHQELHLVEHFTVAESVFLGQERAGPLGLRRRAMRQAAEAFFADVLAAPIDGGRLVRDLGVAERKLVQIAAALIDGRARLAVFDEPTAPLAAAETEKLFAAIRQLRAHGVSILYVSHYLNEITALCDRATVFRNGRDVAVLDAPGETGVDGITALMIGRSLTDLYPAARRTPGPVALKVEGLSDAGRFFDVSLDLHEGEILGVAGLLGSGREELVDALYGLRPVAAGRVLRRGVPQRLSPTRAVRGGLVLVPRDRRHDGLVLDFSTADNVNLASLNEVSAWGFRLPRRARARAAETAERLDIRPRAADRQVRLLSGGNQQKVVLGRWLASGASVFLLDEPTVGVDVGARAEIYRLVAELAGKGAAVLVSSGDAGELLGLCDRVAVLVRGRLAGVVRAAGTTPDMLLARMTGVRQAEPAPL